MELKCNRNLNDFHYEIKEIESKINFKLDEIRRLRKNVLDYSKNLQEICFQNTTISGYYLKLRSSNIEEFSKLPFLKIQGIQIYERLVEISGINSYRSNIPKFLKAIYKIFHLLPNFLSNLPSSFIDNLTFLPNNVKLTEFLAFSTFPALFGHLFSNELRKSYLEFLISIANKIPNNDFSEFRKHWLFDCIKSYIYSSNIQNFLKITLSKQILQIIRDNSLIDLIQTQQNSILFSKLSEIMNEIIINMTNHLYLFPSDIKYLISKFSEINNDEEIKLQLLELIFLDLILIPALSLPKTYGILPSTFYFDLNPLGPSRSLQILAQCFRYVLHPQTLSVRYSNINSDIFTRIPFKKFLLSLNSNNFNFEGISFQDTLNVLNIHFCPTLFSLPDIFALSFIIKKFNFSDNIDEKNLKDLSEQFPFDEHIPFLFFRYDHWNLIDFKIKDKNLDDPIIEKSSNTQLFLTTKSLYRLLNNLPQIEELPSNLDLFIKYHSNYAQLTSNFEAQTFIQYFIELKNNLNPNEELLIIPNLEDYNRKHRNYLNLLDEKINEIHFHYKELEINYNFYFQRISNLEHIYNSTLFQLFLEKNKNINEILIIKKNEFISQYTPFLIFLDETLLLIKNFLEDIAPNYYIGVANCFHSWTMSILNLSSYLSSHRVFERCDKVILSHKEKAISLLCYQIPQKVKKIFEQISLFKLPIYEIEQSSFIEIPIESIKRIFNSLNLLKKLYKLEMNLEITSDILLSFYNFCVLNSNIKNPYSFAKYTDFFLIQPSINDLSYLSDDLLMSKAILTSHISSLDKVLSEF